MTRKVLITGASGLLGRSLTETFLDHGFIVIAQIHRRRPLKRANCQWVPADFSDLSGIRDFLRENREAFRDCEYLINNYGPITHKDSLELSGEDYIFDFFHNVVTAVEISRFFLGNTSVKSVVNVGFEFVGEIRPYKKILSYAAAKNSLLLITKSLARLHGDVRFNMVSPGAIDGASVPSPDKRMIDPAQAAARIYEVALGTGSGLNEVL